MDLRQLQTFVEVVERGSFSGAADALGVTQPAVSQQVASLEKSAGTALIDRSGRRAEPTAGRGAGSPLRVAACWDCATISSASWPRASRS